MRTEEKLLLGLDVIPKSDDFSFDKNKEGDSGLISSLIYCSVFDKLLQSLCHAAYLSKQNKSFLLCCLMRCPRCFAHQIHFLIIKGSRKRC